MILLNQITSAVLQLLIFSIVPFIWYIFTQKRIRGFFKWLGIRTAPKPPLRIMFCILIGFFVALFLPYMWLYQSGNLNYQGFTVDAFRQSGWSVQTCSVILIWAVIQTSLSEEIIFRGFLCKRFCKKFGEKTGNIVQAVIFGMVHISALPDKNIPAIVIIVLLTGGIGYALGWLSLKKVQGSILYGWAIHATVNIISPIIVFTFLLPN
ncbi:MAG: CPBP family intramembrane metalloprotease [Lachnospiraceae bacterium]|nr:CPBP family intramembrane metalloprotease [Lachnospiraceae bacterium]